MTWDWWVGRNGFDKLEEESGQLKYRSLEDYRTYRRLWTNNLAFRMRRMPYHDFEMVVPPEIALREGHYTVATSAVLDVLEDRWGRPE